MIENRNGTVVHDIINKAGQRILVIDQASDPGITGLMYEFINEYGVWGLNPYSATGIENNTNDNVPFIHGFDPGAMRKSPFWIGQLQHHVESFFGPNFVPYDCSVNNGRFGDNPLDHRDNYDKDVGDVTLLLYLNPVWNLNHGGETVFFCDDREIEFSVLPKFCRMVLFDSYINHAARPPSRLFHGTRYTLAIKSTRSASSNGATSDEERSRQSRYSYLNKTLFG